MSVRWTPGGFVRTAGSKVGAAAGAAKAGYLAGPSSSRPVAQPSTAGGSPKPTSDDDIRSFRDWQASRSSLSNLGTQKYWTDADDAARSIGGMPADFNRQQYNFRDIGARTTGRKFNFLPNRNKAEEETDTTNNMTPGHSGIVTPAGPTALNPSVLNPGQIPPLALNRGGYNLTDVRYGDMAGEEIGNGSRPKAFGELAPPRNAIEATAREIGQGPTPTLIDTGKVRRELTAAPTVSHAKETPRMGAWPASKTPSRLKRGLGEIMAEDDATPGSPHTAAYMAGTPSPLRGQSQGSKPGSFDYSSSAEPLYQPPKKMGRGKT